MCKTTFRTPYGEHPCHTPVFQAKIMRWDSAHWFMWDVQGLSKSLDGQMLVFLDNSGDVLMLVAVTTVRSALPCGSNSADSHPSTKALCHCWITKLPDVSFPNASFNNTVVSLGVFFKRTQHFIAPCCSADTSIFPNIQQHTVWWWYTSILLPP